MAGGKASRAAAKMPDAETGAVPEKGRKKDPEWAKGLKRFYDQVVEEPLPDTFADLLSRLDDDTDK